MNIWISKLNMKIDGEISVKYLVIKRKSNFMLILSIIIIKFNCFFSNLKPVPITMNFSNHGKKKLLHSIKNINKYNKNILKMLKWLKINMELI
jgi:hypothetical protein